MIVDRISPERLMQLAEAICVAFPEETPDTYYVKRVPAVNGQMAILPKGILYTISTQAAPNCCEKRA